MTLRNMAHHIVVFGFATTALTLFPSGCGSDAAPDITLSGTLDGARGRAPLAGYKFKCVTLTNPATSGTTTTDSTGAFSLKFTGGGVPFGCFVLNASDVQVASVFFTSSTNGLTGQTSKISGDMDLGTLAVNTSRGTATATTTAPVSNATSGLECPLGVWTGTVGVNSDCSGDSVSATLWLGRDSAGTYALSQALTPHKSGSCGLSAFAPTAGTVSYGDFILGWAFNMGHSATAEAEISPDCNQISIIVTQTGCGTCGLAANLASVCQGTGALTCPSNAFVFYKQ